MSRPRGDDAARPSRRPRIYWFTNLSAPYRRPVWSAMAEQAELGVGLLAASEPNRQWQPTLPDGVLGLPVRTVSFHRGELHLYGLRRLALSHRPDVVILPGWETPAAWQLLAEARLRRLGTVAFYESGRDSHRFSAGPVAALRTRFFRAVDAVVTVGDASHQAVLGFGVDPGRVVSTRNAVDVATIREAARGQASAVKRAATFVYVGQLIERKNVDGLLDAFATLPEAATLLIAGEGPQEQRLRDQVQALGVSTRVGFLGYLPYERVPGLLSRAATLVLPSRSEVYGLVVVEALAAGLHVVVTETSGVYADVAHLPGVFPTQADAGSIAEAMLASTAAWTGPLDQPQVLARTPQSMAADLLLACARARVPRRPRRRLRFVRTSR